MSLLRFPSAAALLLVLASPSLRADHIQSFQKPENVLGQVQFNAGGIGNPPTAANLYFPSAVAVDPTTGKVFISDSQNNRVLRFASAAALTTGASAEAVLGQPDFTSNGHATTPKELYAPAGLAFDPTGRLWVADTKNHRVLRFDNASAKPQFAASADGVLGEPNFSTAVATTPPTAASMNQPQGVAADASGTLWVADAANNRLLRFDNAAAKAAGANADGVLGAPTFVVNIGTVTAQYSVARPFSLVMDGAGTLWVADTFNDRVLRFDNANAKANGSLADGILGQPAYDASVPTSPPTAKTMNFPTGLALDGVGALWVADAGNNRVLRFDNPATKADDAPADAVLGQKNFTENFTATTRAGMNRPEGVAISPSGDLFVVEITNNRATRFTPTADPATPTPPPAAAAPTIALAGKKSIQTSQASITLKGTAASANGIARVEYRVGRHGFKPAAGASAWHFTAKLKPGKNTITIQAISNANLTSLPLVVRVTRN